MKHWKTWISWLVSPIAIGFYITLITVNLTRQYYALEALPEASNEGISGILYTAHQKSFDYRLRVRGFRKPAPNLALLAVDERAVNTIGRWPWPRDILAKAMENAFDNGTRLMAFDIVFSEPSFNPAIQVEERLKSDGLLTPLLSETLQPYVQKMDADRTMSATFAKYADKIVAGSFFGVTIANPLWPPETEFCRDMIFKSHPVAKQWDKEEVLVSVSDGYQPIMPKALSEFYLETLKVKEEEVRQSMGPPKNRNEEVALDWNIQAAQEEACATIFERDQDAIGEAWGEILSGENPKEFTFNSFQTWFDYYRAKSFGNSVLFADAWALNTPLIAEGTKHTAYFNAKLDLDGTIRSSSLIVRTGSNYFPSLASKAFLVANNYNFAATLDFNPASETKEIAELGVTNNEDGEIVFKVPVDRHGNLLINYAGPEKMFPHLSFADLLSDSPDAEIEQRLFDGKTQSWLPIGKVKVNKKEFLKDKIFVVGATATGIYDLRVTPFQENFPGAETHLNVLDNLIQKNFFHTLPDEKMYMPLVLAGIGGILSIALSFLGAVWGFVLTIAFLVGAVLLDQQYLFNKGIVVTIIWPIFLISFLYVVLIFYRYLTEERGKKELRQTFQKYVSPAIVEEILAHPKNIELGGKKVNLTVSFSDVRGFTTISEKLDPRALSDLLNSYLTPMTDLVFKNQGTLDKYMGDAIMSFFGAPIVYPAHAEAACRCALQSVEKLFELQKEWAKQGLPNIDLGIGLNTGEVSVGNMGSETVRSYTVMGDAVNLASRLEGINKTYGTRIIMSEFTYRDVKDKFVCREVDWVRVKGKVLPVKIYELMAEGKLPTPQGEESLKWFMQGYEHYHAKAWQPGLESFSKALDLVPTDEVSKLYVQRCQDFIAEPPEDGWDGVYVMKTK